MILLDVRMPGLDGFETAQLIKERTRTRDIPIVFLTAARDEVSDIARGYGVGAVDYVLKPFDPDLLRSKVSVFAELEASRRALKRSEALLSGAFEAAPIGKTVLDAEGRIVRSNPALRAARGSRAGRAERGRGRRPVRARGSAGAVGDARSRSRARHPGRAGAEQPSVDLRLRSSAGSRGVGRDGRLRDRGDRVRRAPAAGAVGRSDRAPPGRAGPRRAAARTGRARAGGVGRRAAVEAPGPHDGARAARARRDPAPAGDAAGRAVRGRGGGGADLPASTTSRAVVRAAGGQVRSVPREAAGDETDRWRAGAARDRADDRRLPPPRAAVGTGRSAPPSARCSRTPPTAPRWRSAAPSCTRRSIGSRSSSSAAWSRRASPRSAASTWPRPTTSPG